MAGTNKRTDVKDLFREEFRGQVKALGLEPFRADQIFEWVYRKHSDNFDRMANLSSRARNLLKEKFYISGIGPVKELSSEDGTKKFLFELEDGKKIESVYIPSRKTNTVCISSQAGCKFACAFCASGKFGFERDLRPAEMVNQVLRVKGAAGNPVSNVVFMGTGEPLDNYDNVLKAVRILNAPYGLGIGQRKITISTCGIIPGIKKLAEEGLQIELSVSLHASNDRTRAELMAVNKKFPLAELIAACGEYAKRTNRQVTFEYVLIKGLNDSPGDAMGLARLLKGMLAKVNLIPFNPVGEMDYAPPPPASIRGFKDILDKKGIVSTIRTPRGKDIDAACGQLRLQSEKNKQD